MTTDFDIIVVGKGMLGSAVAWQLSQQSHSLGLIGIDEPLDYKNHRGVYASHYDSARIYRCLDTDIDKATLAKLSIPLLDQLAQCSGVNFVHNVGCLRAFVNKDHSKDIVETLVDTEQRLALDIEHLDSQETNVRYPFFKEDRIDLGLLEHLEAGFINPRLQVQSCVSEFSRTGTVIHSSVRSIQCKGEKVLVSTEAGTLSAQRVVLATGAFTDGIEIDLPETIAPKHLVRENTYVLASVSQHRLEELGSMPAVIIHGNSTKDEDIYVLPPVLYPDGQTYIKIGHSHYGKKLVDQKAVCAWFKGDGQQEIAKNLRSQLSLLFSEDIFQSLLSKPCVTTHTPSQMPYIDWLDKDRKVFLLTGGNAFSAKSALALGKLAAGVILEQSNWPCELNKERFKIH